MHDARDLRDLLADELAERRSDGFDITGLESDIAGALDAAAGPRDPLLGVLLDRLDEAARVSGWRYYEPSGFGEIRALASGAGRRGAPTPPAPGRLADQLLGAWLGRCAGNTLGKPVERWTRAQICGYLESAPFR